MTKTKENNDSNEQQQDRISEGSDHTVDSVGNYVLGKDLGAGTFGKVKLGTHVTTGQTVAVKILNKARILQQGMKERVKHEIDILKNLGRHPHIAPLYDVIDSPTDTYMVLENLGGGELYDFLLERGILEEDEARDFFEQLIDGVEYIHSKNIVHRDLKLDNLLLDSNQKLRIADFGLSTHVLKDNFLKTTCGTVHYVAPEILSKKKYHGPEADIWSCGIILYALLCGNVPFDDENTTRLFDKIQSGEVEYPSHLSESAKDLISKILQVAPAKRITIVEIRKHPWFIGQSTMVPHESFMGRLRNYVIGGGITRDPLDEFLPAPPKHHDKHHRHHDHLDDISETLSHESYFTCDTQHYHDDDEHQQRSHSHREGHHHHRRHDHHGRHHRWWPTFPHWHSSHHHD